MSTLGLHSWVPKKLDELDRKVLDQRAKAAAAMEDGRLRSADTHRSWIDRFEREAQGLRGWQKACLLDCNPVNASRVYDHPVCERCKESINAGHLVEAGGGEVLCYYCANPDVAARLRSLYARPLPERSEWGCSCPCCTPTDMPERPSDWGQVRLMHQGMAFRSGWAPPATIDPEVQAKADKYDELVALGLLEQLGIIE